MTVNCTLHTLLTVRGSGFFTNLDRATNFFKSSPRYWITPTFALSASAVASGITPPSTNSPSALHPFNDTYFVVLFYYLGLNVYDEGVPISMTVDVGNQQLKTTAAPFVAVSIRNQPAPRVDTISGCPVNGADGLSVALCLPDLHVLTLTGSGFLQWRNTPLVMHTGNVHTQLLFVVGGLHGIVNDSVLTITLDRSYPDLLAAHDFGAPAMPFYIRETLSGWTSKPMTIQFDVLPAPSYTSIMPYTFYAWETLPGCVWGNNRTTLVNCTAGNSGIQISGQYLYDTTASIGGQLLTPMLRLPQDVKLINLVMLRYERLCTCKERGRGSA